MNDRIAELAALIADRIPALIEEARDQINEAINAAMEDAQERENGKAILYGTWSGMCLGISSFTQFL